MKTKRINMIVFLLIIWMSLPCLAQDKITIHFKDGSDRTFHLENIVSIHTSRYDSKNVFHSDESYQYVETLQGCFIYDISSIENIAFTKFNENDVSNEIEEVANAVNPIILENDNIEEINNKIDDIKSIECVEDAWCDNHSLFVRIKNWETMAYHIDHDETYEIDFPDDMLLSSPNHIIASPNHIIVSPKKSAVIEQTTEPLRVMIANMEYKDEKRQSQVRNCDRLVNLFEYCNIHPDYNDPLPTLEFFKNDIYDYDVIYLLAHGTRKGKYHAFITADELAVNDGSTFNMTYVDLLNKVLAIRKDFPGATEDHIFLDNVKEVRNGVTCIVYRLAITELFFDELVEKEFSNPNSVLFTCACQSLQDNYNLAYALYKRNLGCYLGYTHENSVGDEAGVEFYISMLKGCSLGVAYRDLPYNYRIEEKGNNETANLVIVPNEDYEGNVRKLFLAPILTAPPDEKLINSEYKTSKKVTIEGYATLLQTGLLGFEFSKNESMEESTETKSIRCEKTYLNGNFKFSTSLSGLEAGETYYYRAFSYDGVVYNYGKTRSFKIEQGGEINITEGLVAYYPFNGNANDASGNGNHGTPTENVVLCQGVNGDSNGAYQFGGYDKPGHIYVPNSGSLRFSNGATFSTYFKVSSWTGMDGWGYKTDTNGGLCIAAKSHDRYGWQFGCNGNDNNLNVGGGHYGGGWGSISADMAGNYLNKWTHVAIVFGNGYARLYVDGQLVKEKETTPDFGIMNEENLYIGKFSDYWYPFNGVIDEFRIYNRPLSSNEVKQLAKYAQ